MRSGRRLRARKWLPRVSVTVSSCCNQIGPARVNAAQVDIETLSQEAQSMSQVLAQAVGDAHKARASSDAIQSITREIQLLSDQCRRQGGP